eukprot:12396266-Alexandrium_andersonii.AAC.1
MELRTPPPPTTQSHSHRFLRCPSLGVRCHQRGVCNLAIGIWHPVECRRAVVHAKLEPAGTHAPTTQRNT